MALSISHAMALCDLHFGLDLPVALSDPHPAIEEILTARNTLKQFILYIPTEYKWGSEVTWKVGPTYPKS